MYFYVHLHHLQTPPPMLTKNRLSWLLIFSSDIVVEPTFFIRDGPKKAVVDALRVHSM